MNSAVDLHRRYGGGGRNPSDKELIDAIREVFHEDHPSLSERDYAEHPNAWLTFGSQIQDKWTLHMLDLYRRGRLVFSRYDDQDDAEPAMECEMPHVSEPEALRLWRLLADGDIASLMRESWR